MCLHGETKKAKRTNLLYVGAILWIVPFDCTTMPKVKKIRAPALSNNLPRRHEPLGQVIQDDIHRQQWTTASMRPSKESVEENDETLLDGKSTQRILQLSKEQQLEMLKSNVNEPTQRNNNIKSISFTNTKGGIDSDDDEDDVEVDAADGDHEEYVMEDPVDGYVCMVDGIGLSQEDEALVASMMSGNNVRRTLADIILQRIEEKESEQQRKQQSNDRVNDNETMIQLPPKVIEVYTDIGRILSRYTSGKLPKAFKVIPSLSNWEEVLYLTRPDHWTPQAMYAATRIFASNLNPKMATKFYSLVLLDAVRNDIYQQKKLNYHYYMALKKSVYKPQSFFKGILLPLCQENCTLREAAIVASVLQRVSIPVHHSAVAIHKLALQQEYSGATSIFIKTLLNKKYSLPAPVIGSLVRHFAFFVDTDQLLPVLWHQALLVFVQRYKNEIQDEARESIRRVIKKHYHPKITTEIRRELFGAQAWNEERKLTSTNDMEL
jgi:essential nuclear protein 1